MPRSGPPAPSRTPFPAPSFDRVARPYQLLEHLSFGRALHRARCRFIALLTTRRNALVLGDGDGRFLAALLRTNPTLRALAVDSSATMLHLLTTRCRLASTRLTTHHADAQAALRTLASGTRFDLISTHFFLDCLAEPDLRTLAHTLRPHLVPGALWVLSDFRIPPRGPARPLARLLVRGLYLAFRLLTGLRNQHLPDHAAVLREIGLRPRATHLSLAGLLTAELWQLPASNPTDTEAPL